MLKQYLIIFFVSMVPLIELRGAIPISQGFQLPFLPSYIVCIIGNMLPVPIIYLFARKVLEWGADKPVIGGFFSFCLEKGENGRQIFAKIESGEIDCTDLFSPVSRREAEGRRTVRERLTALKKRKGRGKER